MAGKTKTPLKGPYWELRFRKMNMKLGDWFVFVYTNKAMAENARDTLKQRKDIAEVLLVELSK